MTANIAERSGGPCKLRIHTPRGLLISVLRGARKPTLDILDVHFADLAKLFGGSDVARLPDHRITEIGVG